VKDGCLHRVRIEGLNFAYPSLTVFRDFSWRPAGAIAILEGPSGCGKTTLLRLLAGHLEPGSHSEWRVPGPARLILQDDGLFPWLTGSSNLGLAAEWPGFDALSPEVQPLGTLTKHYADRVVGTLSFGERRILELLRVLSCPTPFTLLDEPLNFLDASRRTAVVDTIRQLAEHGHNFVISSHYETDFRRLPCERFRFVGDMPYARLEPGDSI
jgi:ABC-type multidrug transport system ATPase subunit